MLGQFFGERVGPLKMRNHKRWKKKLIWKITEYNIGYPSLGRVEGWKQWRKDWSVCSWKRTPIVTSTVVLQTSCS